MHYNNPCDERTLLIASTLTGGKNVKTKKTTWCSHRKYQSIENQSEIHVDLKRNNTDLFCDEFKQMVKLAIPIIGTYLLEMLPGIVSIILVGHVKSDMVEVYIDATTFAIMIFNLIGCTIGFGLATAMDTLCSQAYGAGETRKMGRYLQTGILVQSVAFIFVFGTIYYTEDILITLGQPVLVSESAGTFSRLLLPGLPFLYLFELLKKILQAQNLPMPMLWSYVVANIVNAVIGYALVYHTALGWLGAALSRTLSSISAILVMLPYMQMHGLFHSIWSGIEVKEAFYGMFQFISLGIPGMLQLIFEWWAFEILAILSGLLENPLVCIGANSLLSQISTTMYMIHLGISISGNVRVGNALGADKPKRAKVAVYITIGLAFTMSILIAGFLLTFRKNLPLLFTKDEDIVTLTKDLIYIVALFQVPDSISAACNGIFRGIGRQLVGAQSLFFSYYIFGVPFGCFLAFQKHVGVAGLWYGMALGLTVNAIFATLIISRNDYVALANEAQKRIKTNHLPVMNPSSSVIGVK